MLFTFEHTPVQIYHLFLLLILTTPFVNVKDLVTFTNVYLQQEPITCSAISVQNGCNRR
jgi:hypothetical protein